MGGDGVCGGDGGGRWREKVPRGSGSGSDVTNTDPFLPSCPHVRKDRRQTEDVEGTPLAGISLNVMATGEGHLPSEGLMPDKGSS